MCNAADKIDAIKKNIVFIVKQLVNVAAQCWSVSLFTRHLTLSAISFLRKRRRKGANVPDFKFFYGSVYMKLNSFFVVLIRVLEPLRRYFLTETNKTNFKHLKLI